MEKYTNLLKDYNLKVTPQRLAIVEELYKNGHLCIDDLYKKLLKKFPSISLATIYKNLNAMCEKSFLSEVQIPHSKSVYELVKEEHAHIVCKSCGNIKDLALDTSSLINEVSNISDFQIETSSIVLGGLCLNCSK